MITKRSGVFNSLHCIVIQNHFFWNISVYGLEWTTFDSVYSCVFNTSHTVLGDKPKKQKPVCITRHAIPIYQRPGWNTEHITYRLMWQRHHFCFKQKKVSPGTSGFNFHPGWNCRHGKLFTQRLGWNTEHTNSLLIDHFWFGVTKTVSD